MIPAKKPQLSPEEKSMSIAKYYDIPVQPLDPLHKMLLDAGPLDPRYVTKAQDISSLFRLSGYTGSDYGYCMMEDGSGFLATYTVFHNCTFEMLKWFFGWMNTKPSNMPEGLGNIKYKVWCPYGHFDHGHAIDGDGNDVTCATEALDLGLLGDEPERIFMHDLDPLAYGLSPEVKQQLDEAGVMYSMSYETFDSPGMHLCMSMMRPCPTGGIEALGREWIGYGIKDGKIVRTPEMPVNEGWLKKVVTHCTVEMMRLDNILPTLYQEYHNTAPDAAL